MRFKENYDLFVDTLQDILCMEDERRYFIHSFQNAVWKLTHTETKEFGILSDLAFYFYSSEECFKSEDCNNRIKSTISLLKGI